MHTPDHLASAVISGTPVSAADAMGLWTADCDDVLHAASRLRRHFKGARINFCSIVNAKSGVCGENCRFCAQSAHHATSAAVYPMITAEVIAEHFRTAKAAGAGCFGIVTSGKRLSVNDVDTVCAAAAQLKNPSVRIAASLGELDEGSLRRLKESGVARFHHNLETAESFFPQICTTHSYRDRMATVRAAKSLGLEVCCGGIFGLGETREQRVEFAGTLRGLGVDSVPMNFLNPVAGTPMGHQPPLSGEEILRTIAVFRFMLPATDISVCGGREVNLRDLQSWIFQAGANGMMVGGYLTTAGRSVEQDRRMIEDLGLEINAGYQGLSGENNEQ